MSGSVGKVCITQSCDGLTYIAMARARSSESVHVRDIQAMFSGCGKVPNVCVHTTPKYRTPRRPRSSVKILLNTYPRRCRLRPAITVSPRLLLYAWESPVSIMPINLWGLWLDLQTIRYDTEAEGHWDLKEETDRCEGIAGESREAEAADDGRRVGIKGTLRAVVAERDEEVDPEAPVRELIRQSVNSHPTR